MTIPPQEAAQTLQDIQSAQRRSSTAYHYQKSSSHLFLWGMIWFFGYSVAFAWPRATRIWFLLLIIGIAGSLFINRRAATASSRAYAGWGFALTLLALFLFLTAFLAIVPPTSALQVDAIFPLLIALWYVLLGIWERATRMAWLGLALGALTVGGYFWLHPYFLLWMAVMGGGALILGGVWLRKV